MAGLALGQAVLHEPRIVIRQVVAEDPNAELERLRRAVAGDAERDRRSARRERRRTPAASIATFSRPIACSPADRGWLHRITEAVNSGLTAEAAVQKVQSDMRVRMNQVTDPYLRERLADLEDLTNRLQQHLAGRPLAPAAADLPDEFILVARTMGPAELLDYDRRRLKGLVLEEGSPTAHVAIVARALDIPVVGRVKDVLDRVEAGDLVVVDGDEAAVLVRPSEDVQQAVDERDQGRACGQRQQYEALRDASGRDLRRRRVELLLNAGLFVDLPVSRRDRRRAGSASSAPSFNSCCATRFPTSPQQTALYRRVLDQAGDRPVIFRTLDIGGDKVLPYLARTSPTRIRRWAGARSASRSTARRCCASSCAR